LFSHEIARTLETKGQFSIAAKVIFAGRLKNGKREMDTRNMLP
jgi:hypothetical protein